MSTSPFLERPTKDWLTSNRSAFAIPDGYPVSPGHSLVVPRRRIGNWWEATQEERADLVDLINEVKKLLDNRYSPDGYNVGFNDGPAAGQTIAHLHIHIIPRYQGDVPDPRGGIRNVIPERGNYLAEPRGTPTRS